LTRPKLITTENRASETPPHAGDPAAEDSRHRIVRAAASCFGQLGFKGASTAAIALEAGVSKSLVLYHFESKEHLFVAVQLDLLGSVLNRIRSVTPPGGTPLELARAMDEVMAFVESDITHLRVMLELHNAAATRPELAARITEFNEAVEALVVRGLVEVLGPAASRLSLPLERVVRLLRTLFNGLILELAFAPGEEAQVRIRETFSDAKVLLVNAIIPPSAA
jgi:AcrR family transcriptional regulator